MMVTSNPLPHCRTGTGRRISREDAPTEQRALVGFLYRAGLPFRRIEPFVDCYHVAVHDWYHRLAHLVAPDRHRRQAVAVDEPKLLIEDDEVSVWAAVGVEPFEVLLVAVSPGRSSLDALPLSQGGTDVLPRSAGRAG